MILNNGSRAVTKTWRVLSFKILIYCRHRNSNNCWSGGPRKIRATFLARVKLNLLFISVLVDCFFCTEHQWQCTRTILQWKETFANFTSPSWALSWSRAVKTCLSIENSTAHTLQLHSFATHWAERIFMNSIIWRAEGSFQWGGNNSDSRRASCYPPAMPALNIAKYRFLAPANS